MNIKELISYLQDKNYIVDYRKYRGMDWMRVYSMEGDFLLQFQAPSDLEVSEVLIPTENVIIIPEVFEKLIEGIDPYRFNDFIKELLAINDLPIKLILRNYYDTFSGLIELVTISDLILLDTKYDINRLFRDPIRKALIKDRLARGVHNTTEYISLDELTKYINSDTSRAFQYNHIYNGYNHRDSLVEFNGGLFRVDSVERTGFTPNMVTKYKCTCIHQDYYKKFNSGDSTEICVINSIFERKIY